MFMNKVNVLEFYFYILCSLFADFLPHVYYGQMKHSVTLGTIVFLDLEKC